MLILFVFVEYHHAVLENPKYNKPCCKYMNQKTRMLTVQTSISITMV